MSLMQHKKQLYFASLIVAFVFVLSGLNKVSLLPFSHSLTLDHPAAYGYDKNSMIIVDKQSERLIRLDGKGKVVTISNVKSLPNVPDVIKDVCVYIDEMYIMGCDMYNEGSHIANERIEHYTLDGKYLGNVYSEYLNGAVFRNRQSLYSLTVSRGELYVTRAKHKGTGVDVYNLTDMANVDVDSVTCDVPLMAAYYDPDGKRLAYADIYNNVYVKTAGKAAVAASEADFFQGRAEHSAVALSAFKKTIKLSGEMPLSDAVYKIIYDDGCGLPVEAHFLRQHTDMYRMNFADGKVTEMKELPISALLLLYQLLYAVAVLWLTVALVRLLYNVVKNGLYEGLNISIITLMLCIFVIGINSYNSYRTLETECVDKLEAINNILTYDVRHVHSDMFGKFAEQGIKQYCRSYGNKGTLESLSGRTTALIDSFGKANGFYGYVMAYDSDGTLYTLTDSQNEYPTGFHFGKKTSARYNTLIEEGLTRNKDYRGKCLIHRSEVRSPISDGRSVVIETGCYTNALLKRSIIISARNFFDKYSMFLILWLCAVMLSLFRKDILRHRSLKNSEESAFANIPFTRIGTVITTFLLGLDEIMFILAIRSMYPYNAVREIAILVSLPIALHTLTAIIATYLLPFARRYVNDRRIGTSSAAMSAFGYMLLASGIGTGNYQILCVGKTIVGFFLAGAYMFTINAVLYDGGADAVRKGYIKSYYQSKTIGALLGIMSGGYLITIWGFKGLYLFAGAVAIILCGISWLIFMSEQHYYLGLDKAQMLIAIKTLFSGNVLTYLCCVLIPMFSTLAFKEYVFPLYALFVGCSPLLISNIAAFIQGLEYASSEAVAKAMLRFDDRMTVFYAVFLVGVLSLCFWLYSGILAAIAAIFAMTMAMTLVSTAGRRYFRQLMEGCSVNEKIGGQLYVQLRSFSHIATIIPLLVVGFAPHYVVTITGAVLVVTSLIFVRLGSLERV